MKAIRCLAALAVTSSLLLTPACGRPGAGALAPAPTTGSGKGLLNGGPFALLGLQEGPDQVVARLASDNHRDWSTGIIHIGAVERRRAQMATSSAGSARYALKQVAPTGPGTEPANNPQLLGFFSNLVPTPSPTPVPTPTPVPSPTPTPNPTASPTPIPTATPSACASNHDDDEDDDDDRDHDDDRDEKGHGKKKDQSDDGKGRGKRDEKGKNRYGLLAAPTNYGMTAPITGRAAMDYNFFTDESWTWFLAEDGWVYRYDTGSAGPVPDFQIKDLSGNPVSDSFAGAEITIAPLQGGRVGLIAAANNFYAVNLNFGPDYGKTGTIYPIAPPPGLAAPATILPKANAPVWFDNQVSGFNTCEAYIADNPVQAGGNVPRLHRFVIDTSNGAALSHAETPIGGAPAGTLTEYQYASPIVWNGKLSLSTTRYHSSGLYTSHRGYFRQIDLNAWRGGGPQPTITPGTILPRPVTVPPALEIEYPSFETAYVFQPAGNYLHFFDVKSNQPVVSLTGLVLNPGDPDSGTGLDLSGEVPSRIDTAVDGFRGIMGQPSIHWQSGGAGSYCVTVVNGNTLWKVAMPVASDPGAGGVDLSPAANAERRNQFQLAENITFQKTTLGLDSAKGTVDAAGKYVANPCGQNTFWEGIYWPPSTNSVGDEDRVMFMDNWGGPRDGTSLTGMVFNVNNGDGPSTPPTLTGASGGTTGDLHISTPPAMDYATQAPGAFMVYSPSRAANPLGDELEILFNTGNNKLPASTPSAALWRWRAPIN